MTKGYEAILFVYYTRMMALLYDKNKSIRKGADEEWSRQGKSCRESSSIRENKQGIPFWNNLIILCNFLFGKRAIIMKS